MRKDEVQAVNLEISRRGGPVAKDRSWAQTNRDS